MESEELARSLLPAAGLEPLYGNCVLGPEVVGHGHGAREALRGDQHGIVDHKLDVGLVVSDATVNEVLRLEKNYSKKPLSEHHWSVAEIDFFAHVKMVDELNPGQVKGSQPEVLLVRPEGPLTGRPEPLEQLPALDGVGVLNRVRAILKDCAGQKSANICSICEM